MRREIKMPERMMEAKVRLRIHRVGVRRGANCVRPSLRPRRHHLHRVCGDRCPDSGCHHGQLYSYLSVVLVLHSALQSLLQTLPPDTHTTVNNAAPLPPFPHSQRRAKVEGYVNSIVDAVFRETGVCSISLYYVKGSQTSNDKTNGAARP